MGGRRGGREKTDRRQHNEKQSPWSNVRITSAHYFKCANVVNLRNEKKREKKNDYISHFNHRFKVCSYGWATKVKCTTNACFLTCQWFRLFNNFTQYFIISTSFIIIIIIQRRRQAWWWWLCGKITWTGFIYNIIPFDVKIHCGHIRFKYR